MRGNLCFRRPKVDEITGEITGLLKRVQDEVEKLILQMIENTIDSAWRCQGSEAFKNELRTKVLPDLAMLISSVSEVHQGCHYAVEVLDTADNRVAAEVDALAETFANVY